MTDLIQSLIADPNRTNAIAAVANVIIACLALVVAIVSIVLTILALKHQRLHNKLSVRPIPFIACGDYLHRLRVKIYNNGTGPYIIKSISVFKGDEFREDIIDWMPSLPPGIFWTHFTIGNVGRSIQPSNGLNMLELVGDYESAQFRDFRKKCRAALKDLTVVLEYTDIYGDAFASCTRKLDLFAR